MSVNQHQLLDVLVQERLDAFIPMTFQILNPGEIYLPNWHIKTIAWHLERCYRREIKRLIINVPQAEVPLHKRSAGPGWLLTHAGPRMKLADSAEPVTTITTPLWGFGFANAVFHSALRALSCKQG